MSTRRRARSYKASAIVLGQPATGILHQGVTAHLQRHRSSDHRSRYATGQRLAVKVMVPGPNACHILLTDVQGPKQEYTLGQLTVQDARALGHTRLDHLWRHWITNHDQAWLGRAIHNGTDTEHEIERRFRTHWADKLAWLLRFRIDLTEAPRLLSAAAGTSDHFRAGHDRRWVYVPHRDERESDRGYTASDSLSLRDSGIALTDADWETHIGPKSPYRIADSLAAKRAQTWQARLADATQAAHRSGKDIRDERRRFDKLIREGKTEKAMRQLEILEQRVYPAAA